MKMLWMTFLFLALSANAWAADRIPPPDGGGQREPSIAVNQLEHIFIAYIDTMQNRIHIGKSINGGVNWEDRFPTGIDGVDPSMAVDSQGRLYLAWLNSTIGIVRSDNEFAGLAQGKVVSNQYADRPWIKIGPADAVYLTYAGYSFPPNPPVCSQSALKADIYFRKSLDLGVTWRPFLPAENSDPAHPEPETILTAPIASNNYRCSSAPMAIGPNGEIYVVINCFIFDLSNNCAAALTIKEHHVYLTRSDDGGNTFPFFREVPNVKAILTDNAATGMPNRRINMASIAALPGPGHNNNGIIGIVWPCDAKSVSGSTRNGVDICFEVTLDKGESFSLPKIINDDPPGFHFFPAITGDETGFHVVWMDSRETVNTATPLWAAYRSDGFINWSPNFRVSNAAAPGNDNNEDGDPLGFGDFFDITSRKINNVTQVYSTWADDSLGTADIYYDGRPYP
ncbi:MAG: hypothetical protein HY282_10570 [Nitrospirae bacterium]|nr:hypothetical protein [Candidatus Manganitrophaceae bacterium]